MAIQDYVREIYKLADGGGRVSTGEDWNGLPAARIGRVVLKNLFSFLFQRSSSEERVAQYVLREHARGRALQEILADHFVMNRLETPVQRARLLDRPEIVRAFGANDVEALKKA